MRKTEKFQLLHIFKRSIYYFLVRNFLYLKRVFSKNTDNTFLFILSPPYCGSTLLNQFISSSKNVSCNNNLGTREGQLLPGVRHFMFKKDRWDESVEDPWKEIKNIWMKYWDISHEILLDKSIPNIMRVEEIRKVFKPIYYICLVRNPYAQVEGIMRRNNDSSNNAAVFALKCLEYQKLNIENETDLLFFTYEQLCENSKEVMKRIVEFIPKLDDLDINMQFSAHNFKTKGKMKMINLNSEKISRISDSDIEVINSVFEKRKDLLEFFNYKIEKR